MTPFSATRQSRSRARVSCWVGAAGARVNACALSSCVEIVQNVAFSDHSAHYRPSDGMLDSVDLRVLRGLALGVKTTAFAHAPPGRCSGCRLSSVG